MKVYRSFDAVPFNKHTIITLGMFDGVHLGHQAMIQRLVRKSSAGKRGLVATFEPHPLAVLGDGTESFLLSTTEEKLALFDELAVEHTFLIPFDREMAKLSAESFIRDFLIEKIGLEGLIVGFNHTMGHDRRSLKEIQSLAETHRFFVDSVKPVRIQNEIVSSTRIRQALRAGQIENARLFLGKPYRMTGKVIAGNQIGRRLGFPTANMKVSAEKLVPADGVYAVEVLLQNQILNGLANIGHSPTIPGKSWGIEIFIDNFKEIIYNNDLTVQFVGRLRNEKKFDSSEELIRQIKKDQQNAQLRFAQYKRR
jgi:riboflavin kinase/FMN adenylyltransferase